VNSFTPAQSGSAQSACGDRKETNPGKPDPGGYNLGAHGTAVFQFRDNFRDNFNVAASISRLQFRGFNFATRRDRS
jgi:hypothetical protein